MRRFLTPRWILSHLFVVSMVVLMVNLGFWQLRRLDERKARNAEVAAALDAEPLELATAIAADAPDQTRVVFRGEFEYDRSFLVANRTFDSQPGSWLVTPVRLPDGGEVIVSRGWVPRAWVAGTDPRDVLSPDGEIEIGGRLATSVGGGRIGAETEIGLVEITRLDLRRVEELLGTDDLGDRWVQLIAPAPIDGLPVPVPPPGLDEGPHLSYAFQWFFFSAGTVVAYGLILRRRRAEPVEVP